MLDSQYDEVFEHKSSKISDRVSPVHQGASPFEPLPPQRAELFLERLANADIAEDKKVKHFAKRFEDMMPLVNPSASSGEVIPPEARAKIIQENPAFAYLLSESGVFNSKFGEGIKFLLNSAQPALRESWKEPILLLKESGLMLLAGSYAALYAQWGAASLAGVMAVLKADVDVHQGVIRPNQEAGLREAEALMRRVGPDGFLKALLYALKHSRLLRYCANPDCKEPYFVARRHSQVFCSEPCAVVSQRESKLKWWREHGDAARRKRLHKKERGKHAKAKKA